MRVILQFSKVAGVLVVFLFASSAWAQEDTLENSFVLTDTAFEVGQIYRTYNLEFVEQQPQIKATSFQLLDSIAGLLKMHPGVFMEVGVHVYFGSVKNYELQRVKLDQVRAEEVRTYMEQRGIQKERVNPVGYGFYEPLIEEEEIKSLPPEEQQPARERNERVEFKILGIRNN